ncbi:MAG: YceI family protein [Kofleriaceae bacterium]|nr:YceI family protein [Kofleriaceae bacterium]
MPARRFTRSPFAPVLLPVAALIASLVRWSLQGSHNLYTAFEKRFYVPDPDLGWRVSTQHPIWLGLEVCAVILALALALTVAGFLVRRRERVRGVRSTILRAGSWALAISSLAIPAAAFASGPGPLHGRDSLPAKSAVLVETGIEGSLDAPQGNYAVVKHRGTSVTAHLSAGGEAFDARFADDITGTWHGNPHDLTRPMSADISLATRGVDTGIGERSKHAREGYLHADQFPRISVAIDRVTATRPTSENELAFRAPATVHLMGKTHAVEITGTMQKPDATALERLGLDGSILLVQADFALVIKETALAPDAHDFDGDRIPIHVSLVLRHTGD